jgi:hypothetical protein
MSRVHLNHNCLIYNSFYGTHLLNVPCTWLQSCYFLMKSFILLLILLLCLCTLLKWAVFPTFRCHVLPLSSGSSEHCRPVLVYICYWSNRTARMGGEVVGSARSGPVGAVNIKMLWNGPILPLAKSSINHPSWLDPTFLIVLFHCIYILVEHFTLFIFIDIHLVRKWIWMWMKEVNFRDIFLWLRNSSSAIYWWFSFLTIQNHMN